MIEGLRVQENSEHTIASVREAAPGLQATVSMAYENEPGVLRWPRLSREAGNSGFLNVFLSVC